MQQLLVGGVQVFVFVSRFVFDGEVVFVIDIGAPAPRLLFERLLEEKCLTRSSLAIAAWHPCADQAADIKKMRLTALLLV